MKSNLEQALKAKAIAEKHYSQKDFVGAKSYCLKAQMLFPELEGISQMVATIAVHVAAEAKINGEPDFYSILGLDQTAEKSKIKRRYKKMAVLLHPDKNKSVGANEAFRLVSEACTLLSDSVKRSYYDQRRNLFSGNGAAIGVNDHCSNFSVSCCRSDSFWTVCTSCHVQYEYLRKYVNKRLSCKNCRGIFIAVETRLAHMDGSFPYCTYSCMPEHGFGTHNYGAAFAPTTTEYRPSNGALGHHTAYRSEYISPNISFQGCLSENSVGVLDPNGLSTSSFVFYQSSGEAKKTKANGKHSICLMGSSENTVCKNLSIPKRGRPAKKMKLSLGSRGANARDEMSQKISVEAKVINGSCNLKPTSKLSASSELINKRCSASLAFDARQFLIDKARSEIRWKLEEIKSASEAAAAEAERGRVLAEVDKSTEAVQVSGSASLSRQVELKRTVSMSISVPDSDFHDFDQDRSEACFKLKQIWALYDEEDGMPRLYCLIRDVLSVNPFQIYISYLSSKSDSEFGTVKWLDSGFTKSCGSFRVFNSELIEQVNIFSHLLSKDKAGRGGCVRIYPRGGDIWAVYRNWSPDWDRNTPYEVRHQYEMVVVLDDYSDELGVWVTPLIKLNRFKTVYKKNPNNEAIRYITKKEMLRFSHQVPSCPLNIEGTDFPDGCWDLDPAAIPDELLQRETEVCNLIDQIEKTNASPDEQYPVESKGFNLSQSMTSTPAKEPQVAAWEASTEKRVHVEFPVST